MKKGNRLVIAVIVIVIGIAAYGLSPFLAFRTLKAAAKSGDRDRLEEVVDFPAVRENLKSQLAAGLVKSIGGKSGLGNNPFAAIGALLLPALSDRIVESVITPDGIAMLLTQAKVFVPHVGHSDDSASNPNTKNLATKLSYRTLNRFQIDLRRRDQPDATLSLTLERRGLFGWKLVRIDLPPSIFGQTPAPEGDSHAEPSPPSSNPNSASATDQTDGSDLCRAVALARVPAVEDPKSVLDPGDIDDEITQYNVSKTTGQAVFCSHGGYCYPRFMSVNGKQTEVLQLKNCRIGKKIDEDPDDAYYSVDLDRSKNSAADLKYNDVKNTLIGMGLCIACGGNAAQFYLQKPMSECGLLVKSALEGDPASRRALLDDPDYCQWRD